MSATSVPTDGERAAWLEALRARFGASAAWLARRDGATLTVEASVGLSEALTPGRRWDLAEVFDGAALESGAAALVANAAKDPALRERALFKEHGYQAYAGAPRAGGRGAVAVLSERPLELSAAELDLLALRARTAPGDDPSLLDRATGALALDPFLRLVDAELATGRPAALAAFRSTRLAEVRRTKGAEVAGRLLAQLASFLKEATRPAAAVGRLDEDSVGVLLSGESLRDAQRAAARLARGTRESLRWPTAAGLAHSDGLSGGVDALAALALAAAEEARETGARGPVTRAAGGTVPAPVEPPSPGTAATDELTARYQRLALLNRVSLELFSDKPFPAALTEACHVALALTGARSVAVYFTDSFGAPSVAYRHGDGAFAAPSAEEGELAAEAFAARRLAFRSAGERHWAAAPLLRVEPRAATVTGAVVFGGEQAFGGGEENEKTLVEIARVLRNARLIQSTLQERKVFAEVFAQSADAIVTSDLAGRVTAWNARASELFGWTAEEIVGRPISVMQAPEERERSQRALAEVMRTGRRGAMEASRLRQDGSSVAVEVSFAPLQDGDDRTFGLICTYRDITARKEVERLRADFVSMVIHDLRTPLTAIRGFAETLAEYGEELPPDERRRYLGIVLEESKRLADLVGNFLSAARLESGTLRPARSEVELAPLFAEVTRLFESHPSKPVFAARIAPGAERLSADRELLHRLLVNLAGNAVKYSPAGGTVTLAAEPDGDGVVLSVADRGPGVAKADLGRLFEKFYRAGDPVARRTPGTGLGLAIVKGIAEAHGGKVWAESEPGQGSVFKVRLPRDAD